MFLVYHRAARAHSQPSVGAASAQNDNNNNTIRSFWIVFRSLLLQLKVGYVKRNMSRLRGLCCASDWDFFFAFFFSLSSLRDRETENDATSSFSWLADFVGVRVCVCVRVCATIYGCSCSNFRSPLLWLWCLCFPLPFGNTFRVSNFIKKMISRRCKASSTHSHVHATTMETYVQSGLGIYFHAQPNHIVGDVIILTLISFITMSQLWNTFEPMQTLLRLHSLRKTTSESIVEKFHLFTLVICTWIRVFFPLASHFSNVSMWAERKKKLYAKQNKLRKSFKRMRCNRMKREKSNRGKREATTNNMLTCIHNTKTSDSILDNCWFFLTIH